jgi:hypothetical protein
MFFGPVREVLESSGRMEEIGIHVPRIVSLHKELSGLGLVRSSAPVNMEEAESMVREALR